MYKNGFELLGEVDDVPHSRDETASPGQLHMTQLERWLDEIKDQPQWRREADKCCDYYDGNQLTQDKIHSLEEKGLNALITNLVAPTVNAVLGMEAKNRVDWKVGADDDRWSDVADALSSKLHEAERESRADRANSDVYSAMIKSGFGAVEVSRESDPFKYPYRVKYIHRRELFWDWRSTEPDWSDARYVVRKKWYDADFLVQWFPKHAELIKAATMHADWTQFFLNGNVASADLMNHFDQGVRTTLDDIEWRDTENRRAACFEVWYRVFVRGVVLPLPGGRVLEFNPKDPQHRAIVASGMVQPKVKVFSKLRMALFIGAIRVMDVATNKRHFPYIPFWGYREDLTGVPYGLIRAMMAPQDEVNARNAKMMWLLTAKRTIIDSDALDPKYNTMSDVSREIARADAFIVTNPVRKGSIGLRVDENMQLASQQFQIMQERKQAIQDAAGVYQAMMGQASNATSGTAINSLVEQGVTTLAEINDNYRYARRMVGEQLLELIKEDLIDQMDVVVDTGQTKRRVQVNIPKVDQSTGQTYKENDVQVAPVKVALSDVPSTPTYRQQQYAQFAEILKSCPPQIQGLLIPFAVEMSDFGRKTEMAEYLRKQLGIANQELEPEKQAEQEQQAQAQAEQQAQAQQQAMELEMKEKESVVAKNLAQAKKLEAEAAMTAVGSQTNDAGAKQADIEAKLEIERMRQEGQTQRTAMQIEANKQPDANARIDEMLDEANQ